MDGLSMCCYFFWIHLNVCKGNDKCIVSVQNRQTSYWYNTYHCMSHEQISRKSKKSELHKNEILFNPRIKIKTPYFSTS